MSSTTMYLLKLKGERSSVSKAMYSICTDNVIDFNKIMKVPEDLFFNKEDITKEIDEMINGIFPSIADIKLLITKLEDEDHKKKAHSYVDRYMRDNKRKYGCIDHYDWKEKNWGSYGSPDLKDCSSANDDLVFIKFSWLDKYKKDIWLHLSEQYPNITFELSYADEQFGFDTGKVEFKNGQLNEILIPHDSFDRYSRPSPELNKLGATLWYPEDSPKELGYTEDWKELEEDY